MLWVTKECRGIRITTVYVGNVHAYADHELEQITDRSTQTLQDGCYNSGIGFRVHAHIAGREPMHSIQRVQVRISIRHL